MKRLCVSFVRHVCPTCSPRVCANTHQACLPSFRAFPVCAHATQPSATQLSFPPCLFTLTAMAKKSKKAAPEEEAPKKKGGKKKAAAKK